MINAQSEVDKLCKRSGLCRDDKHKALAKSCLKMTTEIFTDITKDGSVTKDDFDDKLKLESLSKRIFSQYPPEMQAELSVESVTKYLITNKRALKWVIKLNLKKQQKKAKKLRR